MKAFALSLVLLALSTLSAAAQRLPCVDIYVHSANGQNDNGVTVALPNGGFQTTYADGWVHTSQPDGSYGPGGRQMEDKDGQGHTVRVAKCDPKNTLRNETKATYANGQITLTVIAWNANGGVISKTTNTMAAGNAAPPAPQGQQVQPMQPPPGGQNAGGPPPGDQSMGGPPPGYDQGPNGPPPGYDQGGPPQPSIGIGGFGFGFGRRP
jgi:hypothetical protein